MVFFLFASCLQFVCKFYPNTYVPKNGKSGTYMSTYVPKNGKSGTYIRKLRLWEVTEFFKKTYNKGRSTKQFFENYLYEEFEVIN